MKYDRRTKIWHQRQVILGCFKAESSSAEDLCQNGLAISNKSTISSLGPEEGPFVDAPSTSAIPKRGDTESV